MYAYYGLALIFKRNPILKACRVYITFMQLAQMFLGLGLSIKASYEPEASQEEYFNSVMAVAMYMSYAYLFGSFFILNYTKACDIQVLTFVSVVVAMLFCTSRIVGSADLITVSYLLKSMASNLVSCIVAYASAISYSVSFDSLVTPIAFDTISMAKRTDVSGSVYFNVNEPEFSYHMRMMRVVRRYSFLPILSIIVSFLIGGSCSMAVMSISVYWIVSGVSAGMFAKCRKCTVTEVSVSKAEVDENKKVVVEKNSADVVSESGMGGVVVQ